jgi:gliding motility-associated-like protein
MKNSFLLSVLLISSLQSFSQVNLNAGLIAYYPFNGNAKDASGNSNNPIFNNATLTPDRFGNPNSAYSFNGTDNYMRIPNSASLNSSNQISICAWVKVAGFYRGTCHGNNIVMKGDADYQAGDYKIRFDDAYITNSQNCYLSNTDVTHETFFGINSTLSSNTPFIQTNQWYSVVYTCDGTTAKIYVNCKLAGSGPANGITFTNGDDLFLGSLNNAQYPYWFNGTMDEIRIYNRAINEDEVKAYGDCSASSLSCSNWLKTPSVPSSVKVGQINVTGTQVTVEALINRTAPYTGGQVWAGDVVSKHRDPTDANYILRPNSGEITTTNGYYKTADIADIELNKTYQIAMVYDGDSLKFYRNGCLMSKIKATGNLIQNSWQTAIGYYSPQLFPNENFIGYINEVRIWNVARTQGEIQTYMNASLPNPTTQPGLLAYYTFDNLLNKQGNPAFNGTLGGSASINETNPQCGLIVASCTVDPDCNIIITKSADTSLCGSSPVEIFASGGSDYSWTPAIGLSDSKIANPVATPLASTKYFVTVSNPDGCSKTDSINITVNSLPTVSKSNDSSICQNSTAKLWANGGSSYSWTPSTGLNNSSIAAPTATLSVSKKYYVTVTNTAGCSKKDSINILVNSLPVITKSNDTSICINSSASLFANGGSSYLWSPAATINNDNIANPVARPVGTTTYNVKVTNANGCSGTASIIVTVKPFPAITKSNDSAICKNTSVNLFVTGGSSYKWFPNSSLDNSSNATAVASPSETTLYHIDITDINSCIYHDSIKISVRPPAIFSVSADNSVCAKTSEQLTASGGDSYLWSPALFLDNPNVSNPVATADSTITYSVNIKENTCNESAILFTKLIVLPSPHLEIIKSNDITCTFPSAHLTVYGGEDYSWAPASGLSSATISNPVATPLISTVYTVTAKGVNGCVNSDTISVKVDLNENRFLGLPNSFTPNGDGLNDCFGVRYWGQVDKLDFSIYNRFGQRVFFTNNVANCWDGTFKGEPQNAGVFVYVIKAKTICGNINKKGTVTLLR